MARLPLPESLDREFLAGALAAREAMGSTGIGHGIALPHVRNPIVLKIEAPIVSLALLATPIDFGGRRLVPASGVPGLGEHYVELRRSHPPVALAD